MAKVIIVEDDEALCDTIEEWLKLEHHLSEVIHDGTQALESLKTFEYDLIILDLLLPGLHGIELCKQFRSHGGTTPILILTAKDAINERAEGLDAGADDYLTKPFHPQELLARVRALLRRPSGYLGNVMTIGKYVIDPNTHRVTKSGEHVALQPMEFALLEFFVRHPNQVFSTEALLQRVWETDADVSLDAIYTCIRRLRQKLQINGEPSLIRTVHGVGYRLEAQ